MVWSDSEACRDIRAKKSLVVERCARRKILIRVCAATQTQRTKLVERTRTRSQTLCGAKKQTSSNMMCAVTWKCSGKKKQLNILKPLGENNGNRKCDYQVWWPMPKQKTKNKTRQQQKKEVVLSDTDITSLCTSG